jgi:hypothetical protein
MSKTRKINLIIKNWTLNGVRVKDSGSNPHSKGLNFSRLYIDFLEILKLINKKRDDTIRWIKIIIIVKINIYIKIF